MKLPPSLTALLLGAFGTSHTRRGDQRTVPATPQHIIDERIAKAAERRARKNAKRLKDAGL